MKLLLDANLSYRLVKRLKDTYQDASHILDHFQHNEKDSVIWNFAKSEGFVIVTSDEDFIILLTLKGWPPKVILLKTGDQSNNYLLELLLSKKPEIEKFYGSTGQGMLVIY